MKNIKKYPLLFFAITFEGLNALWAITTGYVPLILFNGACFLTGVAAIGFLLQLDKQKGV